MNKRDGRYNYVLKVENEGRRGKEYYSTEENSKFLADMIINGKEDLLITFIGKDGHTHEEYLSDMQGMIIIMPDETIIRVHDESLEEDFDFQIYPNQSSLKEKCKY